MLRGLVELARCIRDLRKSGEVDEEVMLHPFSPVELRPLSEFYKVEELVVDIDNLYEILDGKSSIALRVDGNSERLIVHNTERDEFCYTAIRKAIEDSISQLTQKIAELGYCYSRKV